MQIHVVRPGESIFSIAQHYRIPAGVLIKTNEIPNPNNLVVGQTIVIPIIGTYRIVGPRESIYSISKEYGISAVELARINRITNPSAVYPGLRLYIPPRPKRRIDVGAYIDPNVTGEKSVQVVNDVGDDLTYLQIFSYHATKEGNLVPLNDEAIINAAINKKVKPLMVITNFQEGTFKIEIATAIFSSQEVQDKLLNEAISIMEKKGFKGLDFDFEYIGAINREGYNKFLAKARRMLSEKGYLLSTALAPKISDEEKGVLYEGHDYEAQGKIVNFIFFMTYEWGWSGGPPRAVSPINEVKKVMNYAISKVPKNKIMMGVPLYGYDWTLPYVPGGKFAKSISSQEAIMTAAKYGVNISYDRVSQSPFYNYTDEQGKKHEVWFDDARSIQAKFNLVKSLGIRGLFYWVLGNDFPQNWLLLEDNFIINK